jgi:hypothetical protein
MLSRRIPAAWVLSHLIDELAVLLRNQDLCHFGFRVFLGPHIQDYTNTDFLRRQRNNT